MAIKSISANDTVYNKKSDPVKKGAKIGAGVAIGLMGANFLQNSHSLKKATGDGYFKTASKVANEAAMLCGDKRVKTAVIAGTAAGLAIITAGITSISAGIGAGIGKLVKNHNEKKEAEKQEIVEQVKTELTDDVE